MSESRHRLVFALVNERIPANSETSGQWARQGSNLRPTTYEEAALTTELRARGGQRTPTRSKLAVYVTPM
jgi:hypothetical protein